MRRVIKYTHTRGVWVLDRGGDPGMVYLGLRIKLRVLARHVLKSARRLFGRPDFRFYALADGIRELLFGRQNGLERINPLLKTHEHQLSLFDP